MSEFVERVTMSGSKVVQGAGARCRRTGLALFCLGACPCPCLAVPTELRTASLSAMPCPTEVPAVHSLPSLLLHSPPALDLPPETNTLPAGKAIKLIGKFGAKVTRNFGGADSDTASSKSGAGAGSGNLGARALLGAQRRGTASRRGAVWWLGSGYVWAAHSACLSGGSQGSRSSFAQ